MKTVVLREERGKRARKKSEEKERGKETERKKNYELFLSFFIFFFKNKRNKTHQKIKFTIHQNANEHGQRRESPHKHKPVKQTLGAAAAIWTIGGMMHLKYLT
jgi:hypothetical protein